MTNLVSFRVDYIKTIDFDDDIEDKDVYDINREKVFNDPRRISMVTEYIMEHFNQKTYKNEKSYAFRAVTNISDVIQSKNRIGEKKDKLRLSQPVDKVVSRHFLYFNIKNEMR